MSALASTTTLSPTRETLSNSQLLSSSISSLASSGSRHASSQISKIYRQSSTLFLTRRLPESLSTILPVITPTAADDTNANPEPAPISRASRNTRIKVWSLYLTILNAIVELDPDDGKQAFGSSEWRSLVSRVRDGEVWEEVVRNGYGGVEGDVDSDVVINLATLLLTHAQSQKINQTRLENYLASSTAPKMDIDNRFNAAQRHIRSASPSKGSGADTPRDLNARVKILELYTLHVLLRNNEWDYAREFISISSVLDEERREAFLQALQSLQDEQNEAEARELQEKRYQEEQLKKDIEDARRRRAENEARERRIVEEKERDGRRDKAGSRSSEIDYGVEDARPVSSSKSRSAKASSLKGNKAPISSPTSRPSAPVSRKSPPGVIERASTILSNLRKLVEAHFSTRPMFLMQLLAFIVGLLIVISRKDIKDRIRRLMGQGWGKVRSTAGMGVKVSYI